MDIEKNADLAEIAAYTATVTVDARGHGYVETFKAFLVPQLIAEIGAARDVIRNMRQYKQEKGVTECIACGYADGAGHHIGCPLDAHDRIRAWGIDTDTKE